MGRASFCTHLEAVSTIGSPTATGLDSLVQDSRRTPRRSDSGRTASLRAQRLPLGSTTRARSARNAPVDHSASAIRSRTVAAVRGCSSTIHPRLRARQSTALRRVSEGTWRSAGQQTRLFTVSWCSCESSLRCGPASYKSPYHSRSSWRETKTATLGPKRSSFTELAPPSFCRPPPLAAAAVAVAAVARRSRLRL